MAADNGNLDGGEVREDILEGVEHEDEGGEEVEGVDLAEGDEPGVERVEPLGDEVARDGGGLVAGVEEYLEEVGHGEGCGHGEEHAEHHEQAIQRTAGAVWLELSQCKVLFQ